MKTILQHTFSYTMIVVLLVSTLHLSINKMECLKSGNTSYSISDFEDCNDNKKECSLNEICCEFQKITFNYEYDSPANTWVSSIIHLPFIHEVTTVLSQRIFGIINSSFFYTNLSPPSGYRLLRLIQLFRL